MKKTVICIVGLCLLGAAFATPAMALTGREIIDRSDRLPEPNSGSTTVKMTIRKGDQVFEKTFDTVAKKVGDGEERVLLTFTSPTRLQLLTHTHKSAEDDQWLMLTSGQVKRITAADKDKPFVNSHFFYEDMQSRDIDDYNYTYTGDAQAAGFDCYKVEAVKKAGAGRVYDKIVLYARKSDCFIVRIDFYKGGRMIKYMENQNIQTISGILTPMKVVMMQADGRGGTQLIISNVRYNISIPDSKFDKDNLR